MVLPSPIIKRRVKMWAKKSKPDSSTHEKTAKFFPIILGKSKKRVIKESTLNYINDQGEAEIKNLVIPCRWITFRDAPGEAILSLVKEFYANIKGMT